MAYDEAARRLYGPDAYLNLPHLQPNSNHLIKSQKFKWFPSKNFISMFPSCGLLNINAQPSVHVIHQRLQELKQNGIQSQFPSSSSSSCDSKAEGQTMSDLTQVENLAVEEKDAGISSDKMLGACEEKPQIDLNEFLQQLGILKEERQYEAIDSTVSVAMPDASLRGWGDELGAFADKTFNWDTLIEMHGIADQGAEAGHLQAYDYSEELSFPTSIWNF